jgi:hypothetical protein
MFLGRERRDWPLVFTTNIKRIYYYTYYLLYKLDGGASPEQYRLWKSAAALLTVELFWVITADLWCEIVFGRGFVIEGPLVVQAGVVLGLALMNDRATSKHARWRKWAREFDAMSGGKRKGWCWIIFLGLALTIAAMAYSFHVFGEKVRTG